MINKSSLQKKIKTLTVIHNIFKDINTFKELDGCFIAIVKKISEASKASIVSLMLVDKDKKELYIESALGLKEEIIKRTKVKIGEGISGRVAKELKPILVKDINSSPYFANRAQKNITQYKTKSLLSIPLFIRDKLVGVINLTDKKDRRRFDKNDLDLLTAIAEQAAISIKNCQQFKELVDLNEAKSRFIATVAHELKSPLATIKESISLVKDGIFGEINEKQAHSLVISIENINRLVRIINNLLDLSKIEAGKIQMKREFIDLNELVRNVQESFSSLADKNMIKLNLNLPQESIKVWADNDKIFEVVSNLLSNAIKHSHAGSDVELEVGGEKDEALISVQDKGLGIETEKIPKIFERYFGPSLLKDSNIETTGLGLSIAKEIIELHRGRIEVESKIGEGSKFKIFLPKDLRAQ